MVIGLAEALAAIAAALGIAAAGGAAAAGAAAAAPDFAQWAKDVSQLVEDWGDAIAKAFAPAASGIAHSSMDTRYAYVEYLAAPVEPYTLPQRSAFYKLYNVARYANNIESPLKRGNALFKKYPFPKNATPSLQANYELLIKLDDLKTTLAKTTQPLLTFEFPRIAGLQSQKLNRIYSFEIVDTRGRLHGAVSGHRKITDPTFATFLQVLTDLGIIEWTWSAYSGWGSSFDETIVLTKLADPKLIDIFACIKDVELLLQEIERELKVLYLHSVPNIFQTVIAPPLPTPTLPVPTKPSPTATPPVDLLDLLEKIKQGLITGSIATMILAMVRTMTISTTRTRVRARVIQKKKRRSKKNLRLQRKQQPKKPKPKIKYIYANVGRNSAWIRKISFFFYNPSPMDSDNIGKLVFHLKGGGIITKPRVKRGTFSTIIMWSYKTYYLGAGYRYWSQFNKARIVNRYKVLSWFIPRINQRDRELAIPLEIKENRVKYR